MAFKKNEFQQITFNDSYQGLSSREKRFLEKSWAAGFAEHVFPNINEERFSVLYSDNSASRPNTPVNVTFGSLLIKELLGDTDEELLESILFDIRYQHALHTTSMKEQPVSDRTFSRFREKVLEHEMKTGIDLVKEEMLSLSDHLAKIMKISPKVKRMDSLMIAANCKRMSRLELFYTCVSKMVRLIQQTGEEELLKDFSKYLDVEDFNNTIYRCEPEQVNERLERLVQDAVTLESITRDGYLDFQEYKNLRRLIDEQTTIKDDSGDIIPIDARKQQSGGLQNPSDPDATHRNKGGNKHLGYVANVVETTDENGSIITHYDYQNNLYSDHKFCQDLLDDLGKQDEEVKLVCDGAYSALENIEKAKSNNIELVATALTGIPPSDIHSGFVIDNEAHRIINCPAGYTPEHFWYHDEREEYRISFKREHCENCPNLIKCKAKLQKTIAKVNISRKMIERAHYAKHLSQEKYVNLQRIRNGVEGVPSILRRRYKVDEIPVYGLSASKLWFSFKIGAINVKRLVAWTKERNEISFSNIKYEFEKFHFNISSIYFDFLNKERVLLTP